MKVILFFLGFTYSSICFSQIYDDSEIEDNSFLSPWIEDDMENYEAVYFFGISEGESMVTLAIDNGIVDLQISNNGKAYYHNEEFGGWKRNIENYTNVRIVGNKFYSDQTNGEFILFNNGEIEEKCLKLDRPPKDLYNGKYELGGQAKESLDSFYYGKYKSTKFEIISLEKLRLMSLFDLKIMRNEIFARYGYPFKKGGEMEIYFKKQLWYYMSSLNMDKCLTQIEKENIKNIQSIEKEKG